MASSQLAALQAELEREVAKTSAALALEITANLIEATPVDTGHARANWVPSVGAPYAGETLGAGEQAAGQASVLGFALAQGDLWISNNVPYINRLDLGSSQQAPIGFVENAIDRAVAAIQSRLAGSAVQIGGGLTSDRVDAFGGLGAGNLAGAYSPFGGDE